MSKQPFQVLYEDNHLVIVNKEAGVLVQGDKTKDKPLVEHVRDYIRDKYNKPGNVFCGLVHRLDRPVSGIVVFARTSKALERMNKLFRTKDIKKTYWAVVQRRPKEERGRLVDWLIKDEQKNKTTAYRHDRNGGQRAELQYKTLGKLNKFYLLEVNPVTGRPHQIRVQLSSMGCPIRGDLKYGYEKPNPDASINLHARKLEFIHPVKQEPIKVIAGLPNNQFWEEFLSLSPEKIKDKDLDHLY